MAGSRTEKIADIFTRTTGLLKSGAIKPSESPLWYEIYKAFPPIDVPTYERKKPEVRIRQILYPEDVIRAKFFRKYGSPGTISLFENRKGKYPNICDSFVKKYIELLQRGEEESELMEKTERELESQNLYLDRSRRPDKTNIEESIEESLETKAAITSANLSEDALLKVSLVDLYEQSVKEQNEKEKK